MTIDNMAMTTYFHDVSFGRIYHLADIHVKMHEHHDIYRDVFSKLFAIIQRDIEWHGKSSLIYVGGDVYDRTVLNADCISCAKDFLLGLSRIAPTVFIAGNHDVNRADKKDALYETIPTSDRLIYLQRSGRYLFGTNLELCVTDVRAIEYAKSPEAKSRALVRANTESSRVQVAMLHCGVSGIISGSNVVLTNQDYQVNDFDHDLVLLGDIHVPNYVLSGKNTAIKSFPARLEGRVGYPGSLLQLKRNDRYGEHGMLVWDVERLSSRFVVVPHPYGIQTFNLAEDHLVPTFYGCNPDARYTIDPPDPLLRVVLDTHADVRITITDSEVSGYTVEKFMTSLKTMLPSIRLRQPTRCLVLKPRDLPEETRSQPSRLTLRQYVETTVQDESIRKSALKMIGERLDIQDSKIRSEIRNVVKDNNTGGSVRWQLSRLEFSGFCKYYERQMIDFTRMEGAVLLGGDNGLGKSTIVDALCFALYGVPARSTSRNAINTMLNGDECSAMVCFQYGAGHRFQISRTLRPKGPKNKKITCECYHNGTRILEQWKHSGKNVTLFVTGLIGSLKRALRTFIRIQGDSCVLITGTPTQRYSEVQIIMGLDKIGPGNPRVFRQSYRSRLAHAESAAATEMSEIRQIEHELATTKKATAAFDPTGKCERLAAIQTRVRALTEQIVRNQTRCHDERDQRTMLLDDMHETTKNCAALQAELDAIGPIAEPAMRISDAAKQAEEERHRQWEAERSKRIDRLRRRIDGLNRMLEPLASDEPPDAAKECRTLQSKVAALECSACCITKADLDEARSDASTKWTALVRLQAKAEQIAPNITSDRLAEERTLDTLRSKIETLATRAKATIKPTDRSLKYASDDVNRSKSALDRAESRLENLGVTEDPVDLRTKSDQLRERLATFADVASASTVDAEASHERLMKAQSTFDRLDGQRVEVRQNVSANPEMDLTSLRKRIASLGREVHTEVTKDDIESARSEVEVLSAVFERSNATLKSLDRSIDVQSELVKCVSGVQYNSACAQCRKNRQILPDAALKDSLKKLQEDRTIVIRAMNDARTQRDEGKERLSQLTKDRAQLLDLERARASLEAMEVSRRLTDRWTQAKEALNAARIEHETISRLVSRRLERQRTERDLAETTRSLEMARNRTDLVIEVAELRRTYETALACHERLISQSTEATRTTEALESASAAVVESETRLESLTVSCRMKECLLQEISDASGMYDAAALRVEQLQSSLDDETARVKELQRARFELVQAEQRLQALEQYRAVAAKNAVTEQEIQRLARESAELRSCPDEAYDAFQKRLVAQTEQRESFTRMTALRCELQEAQNRATKLQTALSRLHDPVRLELEVTHLVKDRAQLEAEATVVSEELQRFALQSDQQARLEREVRDRQAKLSVLETRVRTASADLEAADAFIWATGPKGYPMYVFKTVLPHLEATVNLILSQVVEFQLRIRVSGSDAVEMHTWLPRRPQKFIPVQSMSGSEKVVIEFAIRIALAETLPMGLPNFMLVDEGFGSFDPDRLERFSKIFGFISSYNQFALIITHVVGVKKYCKSRILVRDQTGRSQIGKLEHTQS